MADVKWIKILVDIFDDEKILFIEQLPDADSIIVIWFKLLTLSGKINNGGVMLFRDKMPYTDEMLSTIFRRPVNTIRLAIKTFEEFGMIEIINNAITIPNWSKHQNLDQLEERKEYMKNYMREYREKQKLLAEGNKVPENGLPLKEWKKVIDYFDNECAYCGERDTELEQEHIIPVSKGGKYEMGNIIPACRSCNSSKQNKNIHEWYEQQEFYNGLKLNKIVNFCKLYNVNLRKANVSSLDIEEEVEEDIEKDIDILIREWNNLNLTQIKSIRSNRLKMVQARIKEFSVEEVVQAIKSINNSSFLKGQNKNNWIITFDWFIKPNNFVKVLEGNYLDKGVNNNGKSKGNSRTSTNRGTTSEETIRLERIAKETGLLDEQGRCGPIPKVDF